jgi:hypothetical protein
VTLAFEAGQAARAKGDLIAMRTAYDEVVVRNPKFERRSELATGYFAYAQRYFDEQPAEAEVALLRAERYSDDPKHKNRAQSGLMTLRATRAFKRGLADLTLLNRALELDPNNQRATTMLTEVRRGKADRQSQRSRTLAAGSVILGALAAILVLLRRRGVATSPAPVTATSRADVPAPGLGLPSSDVPAPDVTASGSDVTVPSPDVPASSSDVPAPDAPASDVSLASSTPEPMLTVSAATPSAPAASDGPANTDEAALPPETKSDS